MKKLFFWIIIPVFISCNQAGNNKIDKISTNNPCDVYIGEWTNKYTIKITANGPNYLVIFSNGSHTENSSAVCENGILKFDDGHFSLTYVQSGNYIQSRDGDFHKK